MKINLRFDFTCNLLLRQFVSLYTNMSLLLDNLLLASSESATLGPAYNE